MNQQQEPDIEKRLLLAVLLSMAILFGMPTLYRWLFPTVPVSPPPAVVEEAPPVESRPLPEVEPEPVPEQAVTAAAPRSIELQNSDLRLRFSNIGAALESAELQSYFSAEGAPLQLIPQGLPQEMRRPLQILLADSELSRIVSQAAFEISSDAAVVRGPAEVKFVYRDEYVAVEKLIKLPESGYAIEVKVSVWQNGRAVPYRLSLGTGLGDFQAGLTSDFSIPSAAFFLGGSVQRYDEGDVEEGALALQVRPRWAALDSKYFALVFLSPERIEGLRVERQTWSHPTSAVDATLIESPLLELDLEMEPAAPGTVIFAPKNHDQLLPIDRSLDGLIDYGWFGFIVQPLLFALKWINGYVGNYGWAIIILTFLINLALFPVRYKQMASMEKMSKLQPKLRSIQDKYKRMKRDDPKRQQMNTEVMALYREQGVNPLGGCLPLLLQMPILFAFYRMLDSSIELRGAPFLLWIHDLSKHDPYYVTPIVMGLTMVLQQKMTPAAGDPTQRRMMMFLPIIFTFFFLNVSSGLAIYFLFSNVFAMMFQLLTGRLRPGEAEAAGSRGRGAKRKKEREESARK